MTKKNRAPQNNLVIKSTEDFRNNDEEASHSAKTYGDFARDITSLARSRKKEEPLVIDTQPKLRELVQTAVAVDRGLKLSFYPLACQMEKVISSLESLKPITSVYISQIIDIDDNSSSINQYLIKNDKGEELFLAVEQSSWFERVFFGPSRTFNMSITDCNHELVMKIRRPASCSMCIPPFQQACLCLNRIYVSAPAGIFAGSVNSSWSLFGTSFDVRDSDNDVVYRIKGKRAKFDIYDTDNEIVGSIQPEGSNDPVKAVYAEFQQFAIHFPPDASIKMKAVLIGAVFLVDFLFFEREKKGKTSKYDDGVEKVTIIGV